MYPADREFVGQLYEMAMRRLGWSDRGKPIIRLQPAPRPIARGLFLAREFGDQVTERRLREVVEQDFEPRLFGDEQDRFGYWFGLATPWPRGQLTGMLMMSQVGEPGGWWRIFNEPNLAKHHEPTVAGVTTQVWASPRPTTTSRPGCSGCELVLGRHRAAATRPPGA
jgi:hypothetical protein